MGPSLTAGDALFNHRTPWAATQARQAELANFSSIWAVDGHDDFRWIVLDPALSRRVLSDERAFSARPAVEGLGDQIPPSDYDTPEHDRFRSLIDLEMRPGATTGAVRRFTRSLADALSGTRDEPFDFASAVAAPAALSAVAEVCGLDEDSITPLLTTVHNRFAVGGDVAATAYRAFFEGLARREPSSLGGALRRLADASLLPAERYGMYAALTVAGWHTTAHAMSALLRAVAAEDVDLAACRASQAYRRRVIRHVLAADPPIRAVRRRVRADLVFEDAALRADEIVSVQLARPGVILQPDWRERPPETTPFGAGVHRCPGANLALRELDATLEAVADRSGRVVLRAGEERARTDSPLPGLISRLDVLMEPR